MGGSTQPELSMHLTNWSAEARPDWGQMFAFARAADAAGVDRLMASDHVVFGEQLEEYAKPEVGGTAGGKQPTGPDGEWLDPLTTLSIVAGMTGRIKLRTQILLAALRRPVVLAKMAATLDVASGGRLELGVGVGWQRAEYDAAGLSFEGRGRLLEHALDVCRTLWTEQRASYRSHELEFEAIHQSPKPLRPEGVPIWTSGTLRGSTVSRLAKYGPNWIPWGVDAANLKDSLPRMKEALAKAGGDVENLRVTGALPIVRGDDGSIDIPRTMDRVPALVEAGVTDFTCPWRPRTADQAETEAKLHPIVTAFRSAVGR
jgi:probable F420-dependent oxidoreductase